MTHLSSVGFGTFRVVCISSSSWEEVELSLSSRGCDLYFFESEGVVDKHTFLECLLRSFQIPTPTHGAVTSWDAASDLLWQSFMQRPAYQVVLFWRDSQKIIEMRLQLFLDALQFFQDLADTVESQVNSEDTHPVLFRLIAFGEGLNFPPWE